MRSLTGTLDMQKKEQKGLPLSIYNFMDVPFGLPVGAEAATAMAFRFQKGRPPRKLPNSRYLVFIEGERDGLLEHQPIVGVQYFSNFQKGSPVS